MATAKDKPKADDAGQADDGAGAAAAEEYPPFHGYEPSWVAEALRELLARVTKLEGRS